MGPPPRLRWGPLAVKSGPIGPQRCNAVEASLDIDFARAISAENRRFLSKYRAYWTIWKETSPRYGDVSAVAELRAAISQPHINWPSIMAIIIGKIGSLRAQALFCKTRRARWPPFRHYLQQSPENNLFSIPEIRVKISAWVETVPSGTRR